MKLKYERAISVQELPALDIVFIDKRIENRSWSTNFRGRLYLHVSTKGRLPLELRAEYEKACQVKVPERWAGYLVATMKIVDCTKKVPRGQRFWGLPEARGILCSTM